MLNEISNSQVGHAQLMPPDRPDAMQQNSFVASGDDVNWALSYFYIARAQSANVTPEVNLTLESLGGGESVQ